MRDKQPHTTGPVVGYMRSAKTRDPKLDEWDAGIRAYAAKHGYNLVTVLREEGVSGAAAHKPVLETLVAELSNGKYAGVIVPYLSHFGVGERAQRLFNTATAHAWIECSG